MSSFQHLIDKTQGTECQQPTRAVTSRLIDDLTLTLLQHAGYFKHSIALSNYNACCTYFTCSKE